MFESLDMIRLPQQDSSLRFGIAPCEKIEVSVADDANPLVDVPVLLD